MPAVQSIDIYGSSVLDSAAARAEFGPDLLRYVELGWQAGFNGSVPENAAELEARMLAIDAKIRTALESRTPLAYFEIGVTLNFGPPQNVNVTIDVVEKVDEARRMPFRAAPTTGARRSRRAVGVVDGVRGKRCTSSRWPARRCESTRTIVRSCTASPRSTCPSSRRISRDSTTARAGTRTELYAVAADSADDSERATALFVLAHTNDAPRLAPVLGRAIYDPNSGVRNNAMRVLMFLAQRGAEVDFPIRDLIAALDFPSSADRNKAAYTVGRRSPAKPKYRDTIRAEAVPAALRLLELEKANNHDPAYEILTQVSGETFGDRDYAAWERWAASR